MARRLHKLFVSDSQVVSFGAWNYKQVLGMISLLGIGVFEMSTLTHVVFQLRT